MASDATNRTRATVTSRANIKRIMACLPSGLRRAKRRLCERKAAVRDQANRWETCSLLGEGNGGLGAAPPVIRSDGAVAPPRRNRPLREKAPQGHFSAFTARVAACLCGTLGGHRQRRSIPALERGRSAFDQGDVRREAGARLTRETSGERP